MRQLAWLAILALLTPSCLAAETWTEVRSQNFLLVGNATEKRIRQVASHLEQFRAAFAILFSKKQVHSSVPTVVVVFKDDKSFDPYKPLKDMKTITVGGLFQAGEDVNYILLANESRHRSPYSVIFHEFVHQIVHVAVADPPVWFNEGIAEYYSTFDVAAKGTKVLLGKPIPEHLLLLRQTDLIPIKTLLEASHQSFMTNDHERRGIFYAQSWALVHFLIQGNEGARKEQFFKYLQLSKEKDRSLESAFVSAFGTSLAEMEKQLKRYIRQDSFSYQMITLKEGLAFEREMTSRVLPEADVSYHLGDLLFHSNRMTEAESYLRKALTTQPDHSNAHATLGIMRLRQNRQEEALKELELATADEKVKPIAHYYHARALVDASTKSGGLDGSDKDKTAEIYQHLRTAIQQMPGYPHSYNLLGFVSLVVGEDLDNAIALVRKGFSLFPHQKVFLLTLAQLQIRKEDFASARATLGVLLSGRVDPSLETPASALLEELEEIERYPETAGLGPGEKIKPGIEQERAEEDDEKVAAGRTSAQRVTTPPGPIRTGGELTNQDPAAVTLPVTKPAGATVVSQSPECAPTFVPLHGRFRMAGTLVVVSPSRDHVDYVMTAAGKKYRFLGPAPNMPVLFSCRLQLGPDFDFTDLHHSAVVYFDPAEEGSKYHGRVVALEIVSATPQP